MSLRPASLRARLLISLTAALALLLAVQAAVSYRATLIEVDRLFDFQMRQVASALARTTPVVGTQPMPDDGPGDDFDFGIRVLPPIAEAHDGTAVGQLRFDTVTHGNHRMRRLQLPTRSARIEVTQDLDARREVAQEIAFDGLWGPLIAGLALIMGIVALTASLLAPLEHLRRELMRRRPDDLTPLRIASLPAELVAVAEEMNSLMRRMQAAYDSQRTFVADAAHQLRTPLAALSLQTERIQRATDNDERAHALSRLREGLARARRVVEQLMLLARHEIRPAAGTTMQPVNVSSLVHELMADRESLLQASQFDMQVDLPPDAFVHADPDGLRILLGNLFDNAIQYTPERGSLRITAQHEADRWRIAVLDSGPGIEPAERVRVLERFYRASGASGFGSGLGLAIAETIARDHGTSIDLQPSPLGGLEAAVSLHAVNRPRSGASHADASLRR